MSSERDANKRCTSVTGRTRAGASPPDSPTSHGRGSSCSGSRGGVPAAYEVATALGVPLDVILVRKVGLPGQPELAMGAVGEDGVRVVNDDVVRRAHVGAEEFAAVAARERAELERRAQRFRGTRRRHPLAGTTALIVDDGIATGSTARAACRVAYAHGAARVILATPVAPPGTIAELRAEADDVVVLAAPERFLAIGEFYDDFHQLDDDDVVRILERAAAERSFVERDDDVTVCVAGTELAGHLSVPTNTDALVLFAHGSGSSSRSPRNRFVADRLGAAGLGTLLFDLLTPAEEADRANVFDIALLASRLDCRDRVGAARAARARPGRRLLRREHRARRGTVGGGRTRLGCARRGVARRAPRPGRSAPGRGPRADVADRRWRRRRRPRPQPRRRARMQCETELAVIPHATHLFEEVGTLERAAQLARDWFVRHLMRESPGRG